MNDLIVNELKRRIAEHKREFERYVKMLSIAEADTMEKSPTMKDKKQKKLKKKNTYVSSEKLRDFVMQLFSEGMEDLTCKTISVELKKRLKINWAPGYCSKKMLEMIKHFPEVKGYKNGDTRSAQWVFHPEGK